MIPSQPVEHARPGPPLASPCSRWNPLRLKHRGGTTMIERTLDIATKAGAMETFIVHPDQGTHPPVLLLMDAPGIREELRDMASRLATVGYFVMLPNLYYRAGRDTIYGPEVLTKG